MTELLDARLCVLEILKTTELLPLKGLLTKALYLHLLLSEAVHLLTGTNLSSKLTFQTLKCSLHFKGFPKAIQLFDSCFLRRSHFLNICS